MTQSGNKLRGLIAHRSLGIINQNEIIARTMVFVKMPRHNYKCSKYNASRDFLCFVKSTLIKKFVNIQKFFLALILKQKT